MEQWSEIRRRVLVEGVSRRQIIRETGMHWETLQKILAHSEPPGYRQRRPRPRNKLGAYLPKIELMLREDLALPRKQRHTAKRIWERLQTEGFTGGYTIVKDAVRELAQALLLLGGLSNKKFFFAVPRVTGQVARSRLSHVILFIRFSCIPR